MPKAINIWRASVGVIREVVEKEYVLIDQLFYLATRMIFVEYLTILSHKVTTILTHHIQGYLSTLKELLFSFILISNSIDPPHDFFFFFINNKPTASAFFVVY